MIRMRSPDDQDSKEFTIEALEKTIECLKGEGFEVLPKRWKASSTCVVEKEKREKEVTEELRKEQRRKQGRYWEICVGEGIRRYAREQGMIGVMGEISHPEDVRHDHPEGGEYWDSSSGAPLQPSWLQHRRRLRKNGPARVSM